VSNGRELLKVLENAEFDIILMDCQMPEMDGFEATAAIRMAESGTDRHVPIIALTASAMVADRQRCLACGMDDHLSKPIRSGELAAMLERWIPSLVEATGAHRSGRRTRVLHGD